MQLAMPEIMRLPDGRNLGYRLYGAADGVPFLALHGTPASSRLLALAHRAARARSIRLIAPDRPGYGHSTANPGYDLADWADDIRHLLDRLGVERFLLLGISGGGPPACALAAMIPARVEALGLASPVGLFDTALRRRLPPVSRLLFYWLPQHKRGRRILLWLARPLLHSAAGAALSVVAYTLGAVDRRLLTAHDHSVTVVAATRDAVRQGMAGVDDDLRLFGADRASMLSGIRAPTIVWQGLADRLVPPASVFALQRHIAGSKLVELPGEGHFWVIEHVGEVLDALLTLKRRQTGP